MKKTWFQHRTGRLVAVAALAIAAFTFLTGFRGPHGHHRDPEKMQAFISKRIDKALSEVDATDAQRQQIEGIKQRLFARMKETMGDRQSMRRDFLAFWEQENPNPAEVHAKVDQKVDQRRAMAHEVADALLEVHRILTPEQRAKLAEQMRAHGPRAQQE